MEDPALTNAVRDKLRTIVQTFEVRGLPLELERGPPESPDVALRGRVAALERQLDLERRSHEPLETRVTELAVELERDRLLRLQTLAQVGKLSAQLDRAKETQEQLFAASRQCILSLRALREQLKGVPFAAHSLTPLVHDVKGVVDLIQELRSVSSIRSAAEDGFVTR